MAASSDNPLQSGPDDSREFQIVREILNCPDSNTALKLLDSKCHGDEALKTRVRTRLAMTLRGSDWGHLREVFLMESDEDSATVASNTSPGLHPVEDPAIAMLEERIDRYRIVQRIGEGGCGTVYLATQEHPVRIQVALKLIKPGMDSRQVLARFEMERRTLAILDHPNIARILDAGTTPTGRPYFVMEYVRGERITHFCDSRQLDVRRRLKLFVAVCLAVQHAHQKGVIHRDLKPSNILVADNDGNPVPKVIDFGIAKAMEATSGELTLQTEMNQLLGTPAYMSPEQAGGLEAEGIDTRSDIYSLGILLYELLTGRTPFDGRLKGGKGFEAMRRTIQEVEPQRPSMRLAELPPEELQLLAGRFSMTGSALLEAVRGDLDWIVMKCLEKDRARRYATANGLGLDIDRYLANEIIQARPPSAVYRFQKAFKRNRAWMLAGMATAAVTLLAMVVSLSMYVREAKARAHVEVQRVAMERLLARKEVESGWEHWARGRHDAAMASFVEALRLDSSDPRMAELDRMRIDAVRRCEPRLHSVWSGGNTLSAAAFTQDGTRVVTAATMGGGLWQIQVRDVVDGTERSSVISSSNAIHRLIFSPDDARFAAVNSLGVAQVYETRTGAAQGPELKLDRPATLVQWSISGDALFLLAPSGRDQPNGVIAVWNTGNWERLARDEVPGWNVQCLAMSPDRKTFATGAFTFAAFMGSLDEDPARGIPDCWRAYDMAYSSDGKRLLIAGAFGTEGDQTGVRILDVASRRYQGSLLYQQQDGRTAAFSRDGRWVATSGFDRTVRLWDSKTSLPAGEPMPHSGVAHRLEFSPDDRLLLAICNDQTMRVWHVRSRSPWTPALPHGGDLLAAEFTPDGTGVQAVTSDGHVLIWDVRSSYPAERNVNLGRPVLGLRLGDSNTVHVAHPDGIVTWSRDLTNRVGELNGALGGARLHLEPLPAGMLAATYSGFWHVGTEADEGYFQSYPGQNPAWWNLLVLDDQESFARMPMNTEAIPIQKIADQQVLRTLKAGFPMHAAAIQPGTSRLFGFGLHREVIVWDVQTGSVVATGKREGRDEAVMEAFFSKDGRKLVLRYGETGAPEIFDAACIAQGCRPVALGPTASCAVLSRDGSWIATANWDRTVSIHHDGRVVSLPVELEHRSIAGRMVLSTDNRLLATSGPGHARLWITATGEPLTPPMLRDAPAASMDFDSTRQTLWEGTTDGRVLVWTATMDTTELRDLQAEFPSELRTGTWSPERAWNRYRDQARRGR